MLGGWVEEHALLGLGFDDIGVRIGYVGILAFCGLDVQIEVDIGGDCLHD